MQLFSLVPRGRGSPRIGRDLSAARRQRRRRGGAQASQDPPGGHRRGYTGVALLGNGSCYRCRDRVRPADQRLLRHRWPVLRSGGPVEALFVGSELLHQPCRGGKGRSAAIFRVARLLVRLIAS